MNPIEIQREKDVARIGFLASELNLEEKIQIVDVGANPIGGDAPYQKLLDADLCHVTGFEPQESAYLDLLEQKTANETYFQSAVGDGKTHTLYVYRSSGFSSLFKLNEDTWRTMSFNERWNGLMAKLEVNTVRLDDIDKIQKIDFLKIDIQGGELMVFKNARKKMSKTIALQTEIRFLPLYDDEPNFAEITGEIINQGFEMHNLVSNHKFFLSSSQRQNFHRRARFQMVDGDIVFIRNIRNLSKYTSTELKKLAVMADGIFGSYDLATACIDNLASAKECSPELASAYFDKIPDWCKNNP